MKAKINFLGKRFRGIGVVLAATIIATLFITGSIAHFSMLAAGARLYFSPDSGTQGASGTFTVKVLLDSGGGVGVNAADGTVSFDPAYLSVASVSKDGSVFNLWTSDPVFSNTNGTVSFSGGTPSPYAQSGGTVISITFRGVQAGNTNLSFSSASALAADGKGTNVLSDMGKASFVLGAAAKAPPPPPAPGPTPPPAAVSEGGTGGGFDADIDVSSPTHPDAAKWYVSKSPIFKWKLPADIDGVSTALNKSSGGNPGKVSEGAIESKSFDNIDDGTWYFHIRFKNSSGSWSQTVHRQVLIDATAPTDFSADMKLAKDAAPQIIFKANDKTSGIDHYEVKIDDKDTISIAADQLVDGSYALAAVLPGSHKYEAKVLDKAGNFAIASGEFQISGIAAPEIRSAPGLIAEGEPIIIEGAADPYSKVTVRIDMAGKILSDDPVSAGEDGNWIFVSHKHIAAGDYNLSVKMTTLAGAETDYVGKVGITVTGLPFMEKYGLVLIMFLIFVICGVAAAGFFLRREGLRKIAMIKRETDELRDKTEAIFSSLHEELEEKTKLLDPAAAEKLGMKPMDGNGILEKFKEAFDISHDTITKEIDDIEKALE
jgi:hypothetical protein